MNEPTARELGNRRLLELATYLDTADANHIAAGEPTYMQREWKHPCGTPACAEGHAFALFKDAPELKQHDMDLFLCVGSWEWLELFGIEGCDNAKSAAEAAAYIRAFVSARSYVLDEIADAAP